MNPIAQALKSMGKGAYKSLIYDDQKKRLFPQSMMSKADESAALFNKYKLGQINREDYNNQALQDSMGLAMGMTGGVKNVANPIKNIIGSLFKQQVANSAPRIVPKIRPLEGIAKAAPPISSSLDAFIKQEAAKEVPNVAKKLAPEEAPIVQGALDRLMSNYKVKQGYLNLDDHAKDAKFVDTVLDKPVSISGPEAIASVKKAVESVGKKSNPLIEEADQKLLDLLSPKKKEAFAKGTPQEQKQALEYLKLKQNIESNLRKNYKGDGF